MDNMRTGSLIDYVEAFRRRSQHTAGNGLAYVDAPGVVGTSGSKAGRTIGRLLVSDDSALEFLHSRLHDVEVELFTVSDEAPDCLAFFRDNLDFRLRDAGSAMVRTHLDGFASPSLPSGLSLRPVVRTAEPDRAGGVSLDAAVDACLRFDASADGVEHATLTGFLNSLPSGRLFAAVDEDGEVRATSASSTLGDEAMVFFVVTDPKLRGRGIATAMTTAALLAAGECGAVRACLDASPLGEPIYLRLGFDRVSGISRFAAVPADVR